MTYKRKSEEGFFDCVPRPPESGGSEKQIPHPHPRLNTSGLGSG